MEVPLIVVSSATLVAFFPFMFTLGSLCIFFQDRGKRYKMMILVWSDGAAGTMRKQGTSLVKVSVHESPFLY